ncbi:MAG: UDP-N-acetylmuramate dehydrogenase [Holosporales bacterium]|jgi:UDP-N-acetylmuramate dehydrogenase|nr:UDP-N-acetylmuramate dehydrogenase [Holosporales bacterium]
MTKRLIDELPKVRGLMEPDYDLRHANWLKIGGKAEAFFCPVDSDDLRHFLQKKPPHIPVMVIGEGSNILIRDGGVKGVVVMLGDWFSKIYNAGNTFEAGGAVTCRALAQNAADAGIEGLEFLYTIPGSVGGALKMNAGCFGREMKDVFFEAESMEPNGAICWFKKNDLKFGYRYCSLPQGYIFTRIWLKGDFSNSNLVQDNMRKLAEQRRCSQPSGALTCGSLFKNPPGHKAWELIDQSGCRDIKCGGTSLSDVHCNFLINDGNATSDDVEKLISTVRSKVLAATGIELETELVIVGEPLN